MLYIFKEGDMMTLPFALFLYDLIHGAGGGSKLTGCFGKCTQMAYKEIMIIVIENDAALPMLLMMT